MTLTRFVFKVIFFQLKVVINFQSLVKIWNCSHRIKMHGVNVKKNYISGKMTVKSKYLFNILNLLDETIERLDRSKKKMLID